MCCSQSNKQICWYYLNLVIGFGILCPEYLSVYWCGPAWGSVEQCLKMHTISKNSWSQNIPFQKLVITKIYCFEVYYDFQTLWMVCIIDCIGRTIFAQMFSIFMLAVYNLIVPSGSQLINIVYLWSEQWCFQFPSSILPDFTLRKIPFFQRKIQYLSEKIWWKTPIFLLGKQPQSGILIYFYESFVQEHPPSPTLPCPALPIPATWPPSRPSPSCPLRCRQPCQHHSTKVFPHWTLNTIFISAHTVFYPGPLRWGKTR